MEARQSVVAGANRGLGLEFGRQLLDRGDRVVATARHPGRATELNALAARHPGHLRVLPLDVAAPKSIESLAAELPLLDDTLALDLLVNCAGVLHSGERFGSIAAATLEESFRTNAMGPLLLTQALAPRLADGTRALHLSLVLGSIPSLASFGSPSQSTRVAPQTIETPLLAQA